jgi:hypothetical protein
LDGFGAPRGFVGKPGHSFDPDQDRTDALQWLILADDQPQAQAVRFKFDPCEDARYS